MPEDWRSDVLKTMPYLRGQSFVRKPYAAYSAEWEHDHCAVCGIKFAEYDIDGEEVLHEGYAITTDYEKGADYEWVCPECFDASKAVMDWTAVTES